MPRPNPQRRIRGIPQGAILFARNLRDQSTPTEKVLWEEIRNRRLNGLKFRRQHALGPYFLDFCCPKHRLVIEVDGIHHDDQKEYDEGRTALLEHYGYRVLRFRNSEVITNLDHVLNCIMEAIQTSANSTINPAEIEVDEAFPIERTRQ